MRLVVIGTSSSQSKGCSNAKEGRHRFFTVLGPVRIYLGALKQSDEATRLRKLRILKFGCEAAFIDDEAPLRDFITPADTRPFRPC